MREHRYFVYLMASRSGVLYTGMTNNLERRVWEHKHSTEPSYTRKYKVNRLVYFEEFGNVLDAIENEKRIKGMAEDQEARADQDEEPQDARSECRVVLVRPVGFIDQVGGQRGDSSLRSE